MAELPTCTGTEQARTLADEALAKADIESLRKLFDKKCDDLDTIIAGIPVMIDSGQTTPRPNDNAVQAMRDVSLAAIDLAREVAMGESK